MYTILFVLILIFIIGAIGLILHLYKEAKMKVNFVFEQASLLPNHHISNLSVVEVEKNGLRTWYNLSQTCDFYLFDKSAVFMRHNTFSRNRFYTPYAVNFDKELPILFPGINNFLVQSLVYTEKGEAIFNLVNIYNFKHTKKLNIGRFPYEVFSEIKLNLDKKLSDSSTNDFLNTSNRK
jgi:hypothetical protein